MASGRPSPAPNAPLATVDSRPGLVWGYDIADGIARSVEPNPAELPLAPPAAGFRWLHVNLADQRTRRWLEAAALPAATRELLLSPDRHQRALIEDGFVACIVHDFEREFDSMAMARMGSLAFLLRPGLIVTVRQHPVCAADVVHDRVRGPTPPPSAAAALDMLVSSIAEVSHRVAADLTATVQTAEDALLGDGHDPDPRTLVGVRKRSILLHRQMTGLRGVIHRLETDEDLPEELEPVVVKLAQRLAALDGDIVAVQANLRLLREELDIQTANRTSQNLYLLSVLSALLLPATLVTGIFGMNSGGLPLADETNGTVVAIGLVIASSALVYLWLRARGFFRR